MSKVEKAQAAYKAAKREYHAYWLKGDIVGMNEWEPKMNAASEALASAYRSEKFHFEDGSGVAAAQMNRLALDDA